MGKMVLAGYLMHACEAKGNASMFIADQRELVDQCYDKLRKYGVECSIIMANSDMWSEDALAYLASKDTLHARAIRGNKITVPKVKTVIADEAHKSLAPTWVAVLNHCVENGAISIGMTATPVRMDGRGLGDNYDELIQVATYEELRNAGWIVPCKVYAPTAPDLTGVQVARGDYVRAQLEGKMNTQRLVGDVVADWRRRADGRLTFCFASGVQHSVHLRNQFRRHGISAEHIDSKNVSQAERDEIMSRFKRGDITVLCNYGICLDAETEVLTSGGWRRYDIMRSNDLVAEYGGDGVISFVRPLSFTARDRKPDERMVRLSGERCDVRITEDHDVVVLAGASRRVLKKRRAADMQGLSFTVPVSGQSLPADFIPPPRKPVATTDHRTYSHAYALRKRLGVDRDTSLMMSRKYAADNLGLCCTPPRDLTLDDCRFIGFWLGDGTASCGRYGACQGLRYPKIIEWFSRVVFACGLRHTTDVVACKSSLSSQGSQLRRWHFATGGRDGVRRLAPYLNKNGSRLLRCLTEQQFDAVVEGLWMADGDHGDGSGYATGRAMRIAGAVKSLLDILQEVAVCRGYRANIYDAPGNNRRNASRKMMWRLSLQKTDKTTHRTESYQVESGWRAERVWCVSVPSGMIVTRRNGKVAILGNCTTGVDVPEASCVISCRPTKSFSLWRQMCGRGLRSAPGKTDLIVLDHSGAVFAHGFPDEDVEWELSTTATIHDKIKKKREAEARVEREPYSCPSCAAVYKGPECPECGHKKQIRAKAVQMEKGELAEVDRAKAKAKLNKEATLADKQKDWKKFMGICIKQGKPMKVAIAMYKSKYGVFPPPGLDFMPKGKRQMDMNAREFYQLYQDNKLLGKGT